MKKVGEVKDAATGPVLECVSREEQVVVVVAAAAAATAAVVVVFFIGVIIILVMFRCATHLTSLSSHRAKKNNAFNDTRSSATLS